MIDDRSAGVLATLLPPAQAKAQAFLETANTSGLLPAGWTVKAISGTRSYAEQTALYSQGRSKRDVSSRTRLRAILSTISELHLTSAFSMTSTYT